MSCTRPLQFLVCECEGGGDGNVRCSYLFFVVLSVKKPSIHLVYALHPRRRYCLASSGECRENPLLSVNNFVANPRTTLPELLFFQRQIGHPIVFPIKSLCFQCVYQFRMFRYVTVLIHVQICQKSRRISCVIPHYKLQHGIT